MLSQWELLNNYIFLSTTSENDEWCSGDDASDEGLDADDLGDEEASSSSQTRPKKAVNKGRWTKDEDEVCSHC